MLNIRSITHIKKISFLLLLFITSLGTMNAASAATVTLGFYNITNNGSINIASQLSATVSDPTSTLANFGVAIAADEVLFTFNNNVGIASNVREVYFDDGTLFSQTSVLNSLGVSDFTNYTGGTPTPNNLPSGNTVNPVFVATASFGADTTGNPNNGLNAAADILGIVIKLDPGLGFADVQNALSNGDLRLGLHVGSIGTTGFSDSFVNVVPVPAAAWLFGSGLLGLIGVARHKKVS